MIGDVLPPELEDVATEIVDAMFAVHVELGPGLLESLYEEALAYELMKRGIMVERQVAVPVFYKGKRLGSDLRVDLLVAGSVIIEVKAVEKIIPVFEAQLLTYLKLTDKRLGFLVNFNIPVIKNGIKRMVR